MTGKRDGTSSESSLLRYALEEERRQQLLDVLGDPIRRQVLHDLDPGEGAVGLSALAERVANPRVCGASGVAFVSDGDDAGPAKRIALRLHHVHLPKLADYGLVEYDHRAKTVAAKTRP